MYVLPLPELKIDNPEGIVETMKSIPDEEWWWQPARRENQKPKTIWYKIWPGHPVYDMIAQQFSINPAGFEQHVEIHFYRLAGQSTLYNHKDRSRNTILFINLQNYADTELMFYKDESKDSDVMFSLQYTDTPLLIDGLEHHGVTNHSYDARFAITLSFHEPLNFDVLEGNYQHRLLLNCQGEPEYRFTSGREWWGDGPKYPDYYIGKNREGMENAYSE